MMTDRLPCIDCITLPMCVNIYLDCKETDRLLAILMNKCSLIDEYLWFPNLISAHGWELQLRRETAAMEYLRKVSKHDSNK
jgi:hypothetical protein